MVQRRLSGNILSSVSSQQQPILEESPVQQEDPNPIEPIQEEPAGQSADEEGESGHSASSQQSIFELVSELYDNFEFVCLMFTMVGVLYLVAGIQYWTVNYEITVLGAGKIIATSSCAIICITGPVSGLVIGGLMTSYYGGYNNQRAQMMSVVSGWICTVIGLPMPWVSSFHVFCFLLWLLLFFGAFFIPVTIGQMLNSVPYEKRGAANSVAQFCYNSFGYMLGPFIYGLFSQIMIDYFSKDEDYLKIYARIPMAGIIYLAIIPIFLNSYVYHTKYNNLDFYILWREPL